jgi:hypothetical protein
MLKEKLQDEVSSFIEKSTGIMRDCAQIYITLLINECCSNILDESLQILNGLASFYADIIGTPEWLTNKLETWTTFKNRGSLEWIVEEPSQSTNFKAQTF